MSKTKTITTLATAVSLFCIAGSASASLIFRGVVDLGGTGVGAVNNVLRIQEQGAGDDIESGGVTFVPGIGRVLLPSTAGDSTGTIDDIMGASVQTDVRTVGEIGATGDTNIGFIFNAIEPGSSESVTVNELTLILINSMTGAQGFFSIPAPITFDAVASGQGNSGFLFTLDPAQALLATPFLANANNFIGAFLTASNAQGGPESVFVVRADANGVIPPQQIPEPGTLALLGIALLGSLAAIRRRSQR